MVGDIQKYSGHAKEKEREKSKKEDYVTQMQNNQYLGKVCLFMCNVDET